MCLEGLPNDWEKFLKLVLLSTVQLLDCLSANVIVDCTYVGMFGHYMHVFWPDYVLGLVDLVPGRDSRLRIIECTDHIAVMYQSRHSVPKIGFGTCTGHDQVTTEPDRDGHVENPCLPGNEAHGRGISVHCLSKRKSLTQQPCQQEM
jgi:hypothetical protein